MQLLFRPEQFRNIYMLLIIHEYMSKEAITSHIPTSEMSGLFASCKISFFINLAKVPKFISGHYENSEATDKSRLHARQEIRG
jgi:hypothetical protein